MSNTVTTLDEEQQRVLDYEDSCIVVAGPGSGKTRTLVAKAQKLWDEGKDLICLTFTRAAAQELRDRMPGIKAQTIHSFCRGEVGWAGNYDKLIYNYLAKEVKDKYEYVLCDEVQDLTEEELEVALSVVGDKLFIVGDPYQSIYGWNGALGMEVFKRLSDLKRFDLTYNYRSQEWIVGCLNLIYPRELKSKGVNTNGTVAILSRTNKAVKEVSSLLEDLDIGFTLRLGNAGSSEEKEVYKGSDNLKVMTCHCSKGLEFDKVILYRWFPEPFWGEEKNIYYVTVARASLDYREVWSERDLMRLLEEWNVS